MRALVLDISVTVKLSSAVLPHFHIHPRFCDAFVTWNLIGIDCSFQIQQYLWWSRQKPFEKVPKSTDKWLNKLIYLLYHNKEYLRLILAMVSTSIFKPETKTTSRHLSTYTACNRKFKYLPEIQPLCVRRTSLLTRVEGLYIEVLWVSAAGFFRLLHQQSVHSTNGWSYIIGSQVKGCRLFTRLLLQTTQ